MEYLIEREAAIRKVKSRIRHCKNHLQEFTKPFNNENYTCYGGWSIGYWVGRLSVLEDLLDDLYEEKERDVQL